ncbi:MAG: LysR family transcriptional regulator [Elainella sp. Prado103]|jgi:DNA-binding transcriptional LysR family regulator|nr:LysR family transcriptional regulator [Elainella sp. Prado103]
MEDQHKTGKKRLLLWESMTLRQLQVFEATARHGNLTRAAAELHLTQPTVSMQVKHLSKTVGLPLFEQLGKRLYITEPGEALLKTCQEVFAQLEQLEMYLFELKGITQGRLRIAATGTSKYFIPKLLNPFCQQYSGINVALEMNSHQMILNRLDQNLDDLYILSRLPDRPNLETVPFLCNPLVVVAPPDHPLSQTPSKLTLQDIANEPFVMRERGSATREASELLFRQQGISVRTQFELGSNEAIKQAVSQGLGLGILSWHSLIDQNSTPQLPILNVEHFPIHQQWYVLFRQDKVLSTVAKTFVEFLLQESSQYCQVYPGFALQESLGSTYSRS